MAGTKYLIIIAGPTAIGKTKLSLALAKWLNTEIISSDSRQYYREIAIGTAKPNKAEQEEAHHHFIDSLSIKDTYSIGQYERDVIQKLEDRFTELDTMIMTGGSGMHIRAITHGLDDFPDIPIEVRDKWDAVFEQSGLEPLQEAIKSRDPLYAQTVDMQNSRRLMRALCVMDMGGQPYSSYLNQPAKIRGFTPIYIMLERDRVDLYDRIDHRVDLMMEEGLEAEARSVFDHRHLQALSTIGYKELFQYFDGDISLDKAVELIKRNSRRYAKRQMTWFRKEDYWERFDVRNEEEIIEYVKSKVKKGNCQLSRDN